MDALKGLEVTRLGIALEKSLGFRNSRATSQHVISKAGLNFTQLLCLTWDPTQAFVG